MGFMVAVGMVVDNSVVVCEAIDKKQKSGMAKLQAAKKAPPRLAWPLQPLLLPPWWCFCLLGYSAAKAK